MKYTKISGLILSLLMVPVMVFAESNVVAISPECSKVLSEVEAALEDAHANKDFLMITVNKKIHLIKMIYIAMSTLLLS